MSGLEKKVQLGITFLGRKFEFLWTDDEGPSHDGITALHTNWASLRHIQEEKIRLYRTHWGKS